MGLVEFYPTWNVSHFNSPSICLEPPMPVPPLVGMAVRLLRAAVILAVAALALRGRLMMPADVLREARLRQRYRHDQRWRPLDEIASTFFHFSTLSPFIPWLCQREAVSPNMSRPRPTGSGGPPFPATPDAHRWLAARARRKGTTRGVS